MSEGGEIREPIPFKPASVEYAPDTPQGKIKEAKTRVKKTIGKYFKGEKPQVPEKSQTTPDK